MKGSSEVNSNFGQKILSFEYSSRSNNRANTHGVHDKMSTRYRLIFNRNMYQKQDTPLYFKDLIIFNCRFQDS